MNEEFYRAFEERYRGSRELIKQRLEIYLPFVIPLRHLHSEAGALDLGCGRGEWLELLVEHGFVGRGVDLDEGMLAAGHELGLDVDREDVLQALKNTADSSLAVVSAFQLVEHVQFDYLCEMVIEAKRVLLPGGLLILETPNPENIVVASSNFYLDPTHNRPIPPLLLSFLVERAGFSRLKVVRLQEPSRLESPDYSLSLLDVLEGASPDYAIVAQKHGGDEVLECKNDAFEKEYGLSLNTLATRYSLQQNAKIKRAYDKAQVALSQIDAIHSSTSWRITKPLRSLSQVLRKLFK